MSKASFRLDAKTPKSGDILNLIIEGIKEPKELLGKKLTVTILEVDNAPTKKESGRTKEDAGTKNDKLAEFEVIIEKNPAAKGKYRFKSATRTSKEHAFPTLPEVRNTAGDGGTNPQRLHKKINFNDNPNFTLKWNTPHSYIKFEGQAKPHLLIFKAITGERENYHYEVGFEIKLGGAEIFSAVKSPVIITCLGVLVENCVMATHMFKYDHEYAQTMPKREGNGTHYGSNVLTKLKKAEKDAATIEQKKKAKKDLSALYRIEWKYHAGKSDCITYANDALKLAHEKSNAKEDYAPISQDWRAAKASGVGMAQGMSRAGWKCVYFARDVVHPTTSTTNEGRGGGAISIQAYINDHKQQWREITRDKADASKKRPFYSALSSAGKISIPIDAEVINFNPNNSATITNPTTKTDAGIESIIKKIKFGFITRESGHHSALIIEGNIWEVFFSDTADQDVFHNERDFVTWTSNITSGIIMTPELP